MPQASSKKILLVPLDWGLGHTTRCIPILRELLNLNYELHIGGTAVTNGLLQKEFLDVVFHTYPSYGVSYSAKGNEFLFHIIKQMPRVAKVVSEEKRITKRLCDEFEFDIIISDNRFGVRDKRAKNIFLTHQLNVLLPQSKLLERLTNWSNHLFINKFDHILVPDTNSQMLSGKLTNTSGIKRPIKYLGTISRWDTSKDVSVQTKSILVILSGPEPQRTLLENVIVEQTANYEHSVTIIRAKPNEMEVPNSNKIMFCNHLNSRDLNEVVLKSDIIISRAGYTTIMDLVKVKKNAILIPTPGQTEQEYLAEFLNEQKLFHFYNQDEFNLKEAVEKFEDESWQAFSESENDLHEVLIEVTK